MHHYTTNEDTVFASPVSMYSITSDEDESFGNWDEEGNSKTKFSKPDIPYVDLIIEALMDAAPGDMLTLTEIYKKIMAKHPYFRTAPPRWRVRVRVFTYM